MSAFVLLATLGLAYLPLVVVISNYFIGDERPSRRDRVWATLFGAMMIGVGVVIAYSLPDAITSGDVLEPCRRCSDHILRAEHPKGFVVAVLMWFVVSAVSSAGGLSFWRLAWGHRR